MNQKLRHEYLYRDQNFTHAHNYLIPQLTKIISGKQKLTILDIGCGNGSLSNYLAKKGHQVVGIEESASGIEIASANFSNCTFIQGSIYDFPYARVGKDFDLVISVEVIEHLLYPRELLRVAKNCLKPEGQILITTPDHGYWKNLALALAGAMDKHFTVLWDGGHIKFFSVNTLSQLLKEEQFTDINFEFAGRFPLLWKSMLCTASLQ
ncbi:MAG: class I SAM-dependent methyltransferase [Gomphosphaeria aponina SAG 52.96 = DSM 107014]|uniref:Class I SAM-dependent methyltransferase n=1 Tax=Gomphosphaeria aponina SAG 52.96 = DSM 107014 TaxID=1521640 RepID=A0A941GWN1_9CHRO|nr:class I SAM-dependent methyltransferase [Gomphosphaeria aponina SAG 52.96 = DSM 107014]